MSKELSGFDSFTNVVQNPLRTDPYIKHDGTWTTLTFDNGRQVTYCEHATDSQIMVRDPKAEGDQRYIDIMSADKFAGFLFLISKMPPTGEHV